MADSSMEAKAAKVEQSCEKGGPSGPPAVSPCRFCRAAGRVQGVCAGAAGRISPRDARRASQVAAAAATGEHFVRRLDAFPCACRCPQGGVEKGRLLGQHLHEGSDFPAERYSGE